MLRTDRRSERLLEGAVRLRFRSLVGKSVWWRILSLLMNAAVVVEGVVVRDRVSMRHGGTRESREGVES